VQVVYEDHGSVHELEITIGHPRASVGDLAAALGARGRELVVDGRPVPAGTGLEESGIVVGSTIASQRSSSLPGNASSVVVVRVMGGLATGRTFPLGAGTVTVGRTKRPGAPGIRRSTSTSRASSTESVPSTTR
jgi:hypothetical protein